MKKDEETDKFLGRLDKQYAFMQNPKQIAPGCSFIWNTEK